MKIVVLDGFAGNPGDLPWEPLIELGDQCVIYDRTPAELTIARMGDAEIALTNKAPFDRPTIEALPNLKYIGVLATGYNVIDLEAARDHGIVVTNVPAYSTDSVAQMVIAHLLNITNRVQHYAQEARRGVWSRSEDFSYTNTPVIELTGKTIGIVGMGNIGTAVAKIALSMGMKVIAFTSKQPDALMPGVCKASLEEIYRMSDVITLHCPLTPDTRHMICRESIELMKPNAIVINTGRGGLVNEQDLANALNNERIFAAGVDVLSQEPPREPNPLLSARNCYVTPHIAWASYEARVRMMDAIVANVKAFLEGKPINVVS